MNNLIKSKLELLPTSPGCYIHKDKNGTIIYVGKAKNLRNRVRSYFRGSHDTKTEALVSEIVDFEFIVTESNIEALLLEINLIKENKPKYNIMLTIRMWGQPMKSNGYWIGFFLFASVPIHHLRFVFITI